MPLDALPPPRIRCLPPSDATDGRDAIELAASAGLHLDPWQQQVMLDGLGTRDGRWAAFEVGLVVPRQNGKGACLEARELAGLFIFGERLILHSAHEFKTAAEAFRRVLELITNSDQLRRKVKKVRTSHGDEGIELLSGQRLRFVARSTGSGRGFTGDVVILDEAYNLDGRAMAALLPTMSARPDPQLWYTSSAGTDESEQLLAVRERALSGGSKGLCYIEYSADRKVNYDDPVVWHHANPALGIRITRSFIELERDAMGDVEFARERLGIWETDAPQHVIDPDLWQSLTDRESQIADDPVFAVDVPPDRSCAVIAVAGHRPDKLDHVELIDLRPGTAWAVERLIELDLAWAPKAIALDPSGPAGALITELQQAKIEPVLITGREMAQACGAFYDSTKLRRMRHLGQPLLNTAIDGARKRDLGDAWAWHRRDTSVNIAPLVAVTVALHVAGKPSKRPPKSGKAAFI